MLRSTVMIKNNNDISKFLELNAYLKKQNLSYEKVVKHVN